MTNNLKTAADSRTKHPAISDVVGVVLAGGNSSRFGTNKALAVLDGKTLLNRVTSTLVSVFVERLLVTNTPQIYRTLGWPMTADLFKNHGPLAGIHAALTTVSQPRVFVAGCDLPFLDARLIRFLCAVQGDWDVVIPDLERGSEPLYAVYSKSALPLIVEHLRSGQKKISKILAQLQVCRINQRKILHVVKDLKTFHNVNRLEDMAVYHKIEERGERREERGEETEESRLSSAISLYDAQKMIFRRIQPTGVKHLPLADSLFRIPAATVKAAFALPSFAQAAMDGFVVAYRDIKKAEPDHPVSLKIGGEIPAGCIKLPKLKAGETLRIMTGGMVPLGVNLVIPFEQCLESNNTITVSKYFKAHSYIRQPGSDLKKNQTVIKAGSIIKPDHLSFLASAGITSVAVYRKPRVGILCTGSELVDLSQSPRSGQIISGNRFLLQGLVRATNSIPVDLGMAADRLNHIVNMLGSSLAHDCRLIITTGGMGPGKYDLVAEAYKKLGVEILYRTLNIRPGKATIFGIRKNRLFFALPGPPPAVRILFNELVKPALLKTQGYSKSGVQPVRACLIENITLKQTGISNLKCGVMHYKKGKLYVRLAAKHEPADCVIHIPASCRVLKKGQMVTVHQTAAHGDNTEYKNLR